MPEKTRANGSADGRLRSERRITPQGRAALAKSGSQNLQAWKNRSAGLETDVQAKIDEFEAEVLPDLGNNLTAVERIGDSQLALVKPKSKKSKRHVEVDARLLAALKGEREHSTGVFVFERETGGPLDPDSVYDVLHAAQDAAGVRRFGLHGLRHLYNSLLLESGANIMFAQQKMGHASALTTLDTYGHIVTDQGRECAEKIAANFDFVRDLLVNSAAVELEGKPVN
jgi:hypothetical protein